MRIRFLALGSIFSLGLGAALLAQGSNTGPIPEAVFERLVSQDAKFIQTTLAKAPLKEKFARKVKGAALLIAAYAQINGSKGKASEMASLRDQALKFIQAVDAGKVVEQKALASSLSPSFKADPSAKVGPAPLDKYLKLEYTMRVFSGLNVGGFGLEKQLEDLMESKGSLSSADQEKAINLAYKNLALAHLAQQYFPEEEEKGKRTRKNWQEFCRQMHAAALKLAEAAGANKDVAAAAEKLSDSCTKCHDIFR